MLSAIYSFDGWANTFVIFNDFFIDKEFSFGIMDRVFIPS